MLKPTCRGIVKMTLKGTAYAMYIYPPKYKIRMQAILLSEIIRVLITDEIQVAYS